MHPRSLIGRKTRRTYTRRAELGPTYTRGLGFVWRIKNRHIGFTFPYLRDHKPSSSSPSAPIRQVQQRAPRRRCDIGAVTRQRGNERGKTWPTSTLINFGVSYTLARTSRQMLEIYEIPCRWQIRMCIYTCSRYPVSTDKRGRRKDSICIICSNKAMNQEVL